MPAFWCPRGRAAPALSFSSTLNPTVPSITVSPPSRILPGLCHTAAIHKRILPEGATACGTCTLLQCQRFRALGNTKAMPESQQRSKRGQVGRSLATSVFHRTFPTLENNCQGTQSLESSSSHESLQPPSSDMHGSVPSLPTPFPAQRQSLSAQTGLELAPSRNSATELLPEPHTSYWRHAGVAWGPGETVEGKQGPPGKQQVARHSALYCCPAGLLHALSSFKTPNVTRCNRGAVTVGDQPGRLRTC